MGILALHRMRMVLQLDDGHIQRTVGLLEALEVRSCVMKYADIFATVNCGRDVDYRETLGRPFMRQLKMIED